MEDDADCSENFRDETPCDESNYSSSSASWATSPLEQQINSESVKRIWPASCGSGAAGTDDSGYDSLTHDLSSLSIALTSGGGGGKRHHSWPVAAKQTDNNGFRPRYASSPIPSTGYLLPSDDPIPPPGFPIRPTSPAENCDSAAAAAAAAAFYPAPAAPADENRSGAGGDTSQQEIRRFISDIIQQNNLNSRPLRSQRVDPSVIEETIYNSLINYNRHEICVFCRNNGEHVLIYTSHALKDSKNCVTCPILRAYRCPICNATGENAHTIRYCPMNNAAAAAAAASPQQQQQQRSTANNILNGPLLDAILRFLNYRHSSGDVNHPIHQQHQHQQYNQATTTILAESTHAQQQQLQTVQQPSQFWIDNNNSNNIAHQFYGSRRFRSPPCDSTNVLYKSN